VRVSELDSVRGVAAFVVVLHHLWETVLPDQNTFPLVGYPISANAVVDNGVVAHIALLISVSPLRLLFSGHAAVGVFFVLSGFALMKALENPQQRQYSKFLMRRFFRIYPPFAVVILVAAALSLLLRPQPIAGRDWINHYWLAPVTFNMVLGHLAMIATAGYYDSLNSPMWTLVHELRISIIFPLIATAARARPGLVLALSVLLFSLLSITHLTAAIGAHIHPQLLSEFVLSILQTLRYVMFFVLGILLVTQAPGVNALLGRHAWVKKYLWALALLLLAVPYTKGYTEICYALGAFLLLNLCLNSDGARRLLRHAGLQWLGKVSYSLYLVHLVVLLSAMYLLHDLLPVWLILILVLVGSAVIADLFNRAVELPSSRLGKWAAARLQPARPPLRQSEPSTGV
jgi:peptidoglycan/LPS O-acetylase OafA/YrhL